MQSNAGLSQSSTAFYEELVKSIAEPEPMCLALVRFQVAEDGILESLSPELRKKLPVAVAQAVHDRLSRNLRKYDLLSRVEQNIFVVALKTLVNESELETRIAGLVETLQRPYVFQEGEIGVNVMIGSAIRVPGEKPSSLLRRADLAASQN